MPTAFLSGKNIYLRTLQSQDFSDYLVRWYNDREVTRYLFRGTYPSQAEHLQQNYQQTLDKNNEIELLVALKNEHTPIGIAGLHALNPVAHSAEIRILMGDKQQWGHGYATEATQLLLAYAFEILNLHKVYLGVNAEQMNALRVYEKSGFVIEGRLRDEIYRNGRYYDAIRMSLLKTEYQQEKQKWSIIKEIEQQFPG